MIVWEVFKAMKIVKKFKNQKGQTLIEAVVALGIAVAIISAITSLVITSLNATTFSKNQSQASEYAQQGLESIRSLVSANYSSFLNTYSSQSYCLDSNNNLNVNLSNCNSVKTGIFTKEVDFVQNSADCQGYLKATVIVSWSDNKCTDRLKLYCHNVSVSTCFANINSMVSPI